MSDDVDNRMQGGAGGGDPTLSSPLPIGCVIWGGREGREVTAHRNVIFDQKIQTHTYFFQIRERFDIFHRD